MVEVSDNERDTSDGSIAEESADEVLAAMGSDAESDVNDSDGESDPWGGSQYSSGPEEHFGFMRDDTYERFNYMNETLVPDESDTEGELTVEYDEVDRLEFTEYLRTMKVSDDGVEPTLKPTKVRIPHTGMRPKRTIDQNRCLTAFVEINGLKAFVLFDSGSTSDAISPDFAKHAKLRVFQLENPVTLQLGTKGSRAKINHGCYSTYQLNGKESKSYFDIANVDRYDAVVGTVFMRKHSISLHFKDDSIRVNGSPIPSLSEGEELRELARRNAKRVSSKYEIPDGKEIDIKRRPVREK
ncbi:hypothetical protein PQX77_006276 [Marasmius sp. AFHP31]|nr:hypothetical protein PQX77_006276 [Marasmius sp. AFHP31]